MIGPASHAAAYAGFFDNVEVGWAYVSSGFSTQAAYDEIARQQQQLRAAGLALPTSAAESKAYLAAQDAQIQSMYARYQSEPDKRASAVAPWLVAAGATAAVVVGGRYYMRRRR